MRAAVEVFRRTPVRSRALFYERPRGKPTRPRCDRFVFGNPAGRVPLRILDTRLARLRRESDLEQVELEMIVSFQRPRRRSCG